MKWIVLVGVLCLGSCFAQDYRVMAREIISESIGDTEWRNKKSSVEANYLIWVKDHGDSKIDAYLDAVLTEKVKDFGKKKTVENLKEVMVWVGLHSAFDVKLPKWVEKCLEDRKDELDRLDVHSFDWSAALEAFKGGDK